MTFFIIGTVWESFACTLAKMTLIFYGSDLDFFFFFFWGGGEGGGGGTGAGGGGLNFFCWEWALICMRPFYQATHCTSFSLQSEGQNLNSEKFRN